MKKLYIILLFVSIAGFARAQEEVSAEKRQQDIEALKVAFISKELQLTPEEAQKFWPVYNQYTKELKTIVKDEENVLPREEKVVELRKKYKDQFTNILGAQRMNGLFNAQEKFRQLLIKSMRNQNMRNRANNRPLLRRGG